MSNLSIQTVFGAPGVDTANPTQRAFEQSAQQRHYAQAFDEAMQRQSQQQRAPSSPEPQRAKDTAAQPNPSAARNAAQPTRNTEAHSQRPVQAQGSAQAAQTATNNAAAARSRAGEPAGQTEATEASADAPALREAQETNDNATTLTGDLFASLDLSVRAPAEAAATASQEATKLATPADGNTAPAALVAAVVTTDAQAQPEAGSALEHVPGPAGAATQAPKAKTAALPTAAAATEAPHAKDGTTAQATHTLPMADATHTNDTREGPGHPLARTEHTALSLSAALSASATPAASLNPGASTYTLGHAQVQAPVGSAGFAADFSQRVFMLAGQRVQSAQIALTPADLGPIHISMELKGQEASVLISATHAATRAAIEDALPKLREMFQSQGLDLVNTQVGSQTGQWNGQGNQPGHSAWRHHGQELSSSHPSETPAGAQTATSTPASAARTGQMRLIDVRV